VNFHWPFFVYEDYFQAPLTKVCLRFLNFSELYKETVKTVNIY